LKKFAIIAVSAALGLGLASCEGDVKAGDPPDNAKDSLEKVENLDLSKLSPETMKETVSKLVDEIASKLGDVKDLASAENLKEKVGPALEKMSKLKDVLGEKMPELSALKDAAQKLKSQFEGDSAIMKVLQPLIDKVQNLLK